MRFFPSLLTGVVLGAAATWWWLSPTPATSSLARPSSPDAGATPSATANPNASSPLSTAPRLVLPPRLVATEAADALAAYLALAPLPGDAAPAEWGERAARLRALLTVLPDEQFHPLLAALGVRGGDAEIRLRWIAFDVWIERDPPAAARWVASVGPGPALDKRERVRHTTKALQAWTRTDFTAAYAWAATLPNPDLARASVGHLITHLAATDPARAIALARERGEEFFLGARSGIFETWAEADPAAALRSLGGTLLEENGNQRRVQQALIRWIERDAAAALRWGVTQDAGAAPHSRLLQGGQLAHNATDPRAVANLLAGEEFFSGQGRMLGEFVSSWATRDPAALRAWLAALPDADRRVALVERIHPNNFVRLGDPTGFLDLATLLPPGPARDGKIGTFFAEWSRTDPDAALAWLGQHDDPAYATAASRVQGTLLGALAATDPADALTRWQALPDDEARTAALPEIARAWARTNPGATARWLGEQTLPPDDLTPEQQQRLQIARMQGLDPPAGLQRPTETMRIATYAWSQQDPLAALRWAESLPDAQNRDTALRALGGTQSDRPARSAHANLLALIADEPTRQQLLTRHLTDWLRIDIPAARDWLESSDALPPEAAAQLLMDVNATPTP